MDDTAHYVEVQQLMAELNYALEGIKDYKDGRWTEWWENGKKVLEIEYKNGKEVSRKSF